MNIFDATGLTDGATDEITVASSSKSIEVMNMCHLALDVTGDTQGLMFTLQPFQSKAKVVNSGQTVQFKLHQPITQAIQNPNEYVQVNQSTEPTESAVQALAFVPVYTDNVQLTGTNSVAIASGSTVGINGTPTVQFAAGQNVGINGTANVQFPTAQQVTLASNAGVIIEGSNVTQDANIINQTITTNPTVIGTEKSFTISNLAAGASTGDLLVNIPFALYDTLYFRLNSSSGEMNNYQVELLAVQINAYGLWTLNPQENIVKAESNANIAFSAPFVLSTPTLFDGIYLVVKNTGTSTIVSDTLTIQPYGKYATQSNQFASQSQTTAFNIASQSINPSSTTPWTFTPALSSTNFKKVTVEVQMSSSSGLGQGGNVVEFLTVLQVSNDGTNFTTPQGYTVGAATGGSAAPFANLITTTNGALTLATDSSSVFTSSPAGIPAMASGYPYIRFAIYIANNSTSTAFTAGAAGNVIVNYLE